MVLPRLSFCNLNTQKADVGIGLMIPAHRSSRFSILDLAASFHWVTSKAKEKVWCLVRAPPLSATWVFL